MDIIARRPRPSVQDVLAEDTNPAPAIMREESPAMGLSDEDVSTERYFDKGWHDREVEQVWRKCWQMGLPFPEHALRDALFLLLRSQRPR